MAELRAEIDALDARLMTLLAERLAYTDRAPALKQAEGISAAAPSRRSEVIANVRARAEACGFAPDIAEPMWQVMIDAVIAREEAVMGKSGEDG